MEKKKKAWQRRGLFALVSNRRTEPVAPDDALFPAVEEDDPAQEEQ